MAASTDIPYIITIGRRLFLDQVKILAPEVLQDLKDNVLPAFEVSLGVQHSDPPPKWRDEFNLPDWHVLFANTMDDPGLVPVWQKLQQWGERWNLTNEWLREAALDTLLSWIQRPPSDRQLEWYYRYLHLAEDVPPPFTIKAQWCFHRWEDFENAIMAGLNEYKTIIDAYCERIGYDPQAEEAFNKLHLEWLVLFQCKQMSPAGIRAWHQTHHGESLTIGNFIHAKDALAAKIGLTVRKGNRGKPRGQAPRRRNKVK